VVVFSGTAMVAVAFDLRMSFGISGNNNNEMDEMDEIWVK
jgi:hypothetical protein